MSAKRTSGPRCGFHICAECVSGSAARTCPRIPRGTEARATRLAGQKADTSVVINGLQWGLIYAAMVRCAESRPATMWFMQVDLRGLGAIPETPSWVKDVD
jgi:hypothetical protein